MNDFSVGPELLDELVSAALDGELGAATAELGLDLERTEAWLRTDAAAIERYDALSAAQAAVRADAVVLDDLERRRLVRGAVAAAPGRDLRRWAGGLVAAGAAAAVVMGIVVAGNRSRSPEQPVAVGAASVDQAPMAKSAAPAIADFGAVESADALVTDLRAAPPAPGQSRGLVAGAIEAVPPDPAQSDPGQSDPAQPDPSQSDPGQSDPAQSDPGQPDPTGPATGAEVASSLGTQCLAALPGTDATRPAVVVARLEYRGTAAVVATAPGASGTTAWVFTPADCRLLLTVQVS